MTSEPPDPEPPMDNRASSASKTTVSKLSCGRSPVGKRLSQDEVGESDLKGETEPDSCWGGVGVEEGEVFFKNLPNDEKVPSRVDRVWSTVLEAIV